MPETLQRTTPERLENAELQRQVVVREPKALTTEYHKARKQLMLWSGILFIWELVGIDLEKGKDAGGNAGAIISSIKNPRAVPWAFLILVGYFSFKLIIEWRQCNPSRRTVVEARIDFLSACVVAFLAVALYAGQTISHLEIANTRGYILTSSLAGVSIALAGWLTVIAVRNRQFENLHHDRTMFLPRVGIIVVLSLIAILLITFATVSTKVVLIVLASTGVAIVVLNTFWTIQDRAQRRQLEALGYREISADDEGRQQDPHT